MRTILLTLLISTSCTQKNNSKDVVEKRDGLAYKKGTSELFSGIRTGYKENGKVSYKIEYENGVRNGKATWFYENGQKKLEGHIIKEKKEGEWKRWHEDGVLSLEMTYSNDKLNGRYVEYHANGKIAEIGLKKDGKFQGIGKSYHEDGSINGEIIYDNGIPNGRAIRYYKNGQIESDCTYINGLRQGESKSFYQNGVLSTKTNYKDDKLDGLFTVYHKNGQIAASGFNKVGKLDGRWLYYDSLRHLLEERFYKDRVLTNRINYVR